MEENLTKEIVFEEITRLVNNFKITYIDAVTYFCEKNDLDCSDPSFIALLSPSIKSNIEREALELNLLKTKKKKKIYDCL